MQSNNENKKYMPGIKFRVDRLSDLAADKGQVKGRSAKVGLPEGASERETKEEEEGHTGEKYL